MIWGSNDEVNEYAAKAQAKFDALMEEHGKSP